MATDILRGVSLSFRESMAGHLDVSGQPISVRLDGKVGIDDLSAFLHVGARRATLTGTVTADALGGTQPIRHGELGLFVADPTTGARQLVYTFQTTDASSQPYFFRGHKDIVHDPGTVDVLDDMTRLSCTLHRGSDASGPVVGSGVLRFDLRDLPALVASSEVTGGSPWAQVAARAAFASFVYGELREEYLGESRLTYDTHYENLVIDAALAPAAGATRLFLVAGAHDRGFPWGDGELFWDLLLVLDDGAGGVERYCVSDRVLRGMEIDLDRGLFRYAGPVFRLEGVHSTSFSAMRRGDASLQPCQLSVELTLDAVRDHAVEAPFAVDRTSAHETPADKLAELHALLPSAHPLGVLITPYAVSVRSGTVRITAGSGAPRELAIAPAQTFGEGERAVLRNLRVPTLLYDYVCALDPAARTARVQLDTRTLRDAREHWGKDRVDAFLGAVVSRVASLSLDVQADGSRSSLVTGHHGDAPRLRRVGVPLLEVRNDHFPTAVLRRSIVMVRDEAGHLHRALEEDMALMRLEPINSDSEAVVAAIADDDKARALDQVLAHTRFDALVEAAVARAGKPRDAFSIVIKPNFMFSYDRRDRSTYTDPALVAQLARRLRRNGFVRITVVEAQSTYGEYFDRRSVKEMAEYLGYIGHDDDGALYDIVDLTEDATEQRYFGPHLGVHPVSPTWRDADFRISFAKNKTHAYAFYTLCLKNLFGALPLANKYKEYHCARDIYHTTMELLRAFPVHFGLIDAYLSADGPFGVFADPAPNPTHTIIGGPSLIAVDWVAASKMGIDPMISTYMRLAVDEYGKPAIRLIGDDSLYRPWLNVPVGLTLFTKRGMDADYHFGNLIYMALAQMDETHFTYRNGSRLLRAMRKLTLPLRRTFFLRTGEHPTWANRFASWFLTELGE